MGERGDVVDKPANQGTARRYVVLVAKPDNTIVTLPEADRFAIELVG